MQVNLPSFQKNDIILSLIVYNYCKKDICIWPLVIIFLTVKQNYLKLYLDFFPLIINGRSNFISLIFCGDLRIIRQTLWI